MRQFFWRVAIGGLIWLQAGGAARACDLCAVYRAQEMGKAKGSINLGVVEQFTHFGTLQEDGRKVDNEADQRLESSITQISLGYQIVEPFGVQVVVPAIYRDFRRPEDSRIDEGTVSGIGDVSLVGYWRAHPFMNMEKKTMLSVNVLAGIKFPTGDSDRLREEENETEPAPGVQPSAIHGHDLALGSGSYDGIVGGGFAFQQHRWLCTAAVEYSIRTEGDFDYECGNDLLWNIKPGYYLWLSEKGTCALKAALHGEDKAEDKHHGEEADDTAITAWYLGPEISCTWGDRLSAALGAEFPLDIDNSALQIVPDYKVLAAATWRL